MQILIKLNLIKYTLIILLILSGVFLLYTSLFRKTPAAIEPILKNIQIRNHKILTTKVLPSKAEAEADYSQSHIYQYHIKPINPEQPIFDLTAVVVHSRESSGFNIHDLAKQADLLDLVNITSQNQYQSRKQNNFEIGYYADKIALRSCIVPGGRATTIGLQNAVAEVRQTGFRARAEQVLGLKANLRWECMLVYISMPKEQGGDEALLSAWNSVYPALSAALEQH